MKESNAMNLLPGANNKVYAYEGIWSEALDKGAIKTTNDHLGEGVGNLIRSKKQEPEPSKESSYKNIIDALDEAAISDVWRYVVVDRSAEEKEYLLHYTNSIKEMVRCTFADSNQTE